MYIRKISVGSDYKNGAMHYVSGQSVLDGSYIIHEIQSDGLCFKVWIEKDSEVVLWKEFNSNIPVSVEYNINF